MANLRHSSARRDTESIMQPPDNEEYVMRQIRRFSTMTEHSLDEIEALIKQGYPMNSPEVKHLQQKLHDLELKCNFWRNRMLKYL